MAALTAPWLRPLSRGAIFTGLVMCALPALALILTVTAQDWSPAHAVLNSLPRTLGLTAAAAVTAGATGGVLGYSCTRLSSRIRIPLMLLLTIPILLPTYVLALAWSVWLLPVLPLGQGGASAVIAGLLPTIWVWSAALYPLPLWATFTALRRWNTAWSEAASSHGIAAGARTSLRLRYLLAPVSAAVLFVWLLTLSDFAVPDYFRVSVYGTEAFIEVASYGNVPGAIVASLPCIVLAFLAMLGLARLWRRWQLTTDAIDRTSDSSRSRTTTRAHASSRGAAGITVAGSLVFVVVPLVALFHAARNIESFFALWPTLWPDAVASTTLSLLVVVAILPIAALIGYVTQRGIVRHATVVRAAFAALFALPAALLGLAGIALWNQPGAIGAVYTSGAALVLLLIARWLPLAHELHHASVRSVPAPLEEAAWTHGASWAVTFRHIVLRYARSSLLATGMLVFILAFNDLTLAALLAPPGWTTLPLRVFSTVHYGSASTLAAICLWQLLFLLVPLTALAWFSRRAWSRA